MKGNIVLPSKAAIRRHHPLILLLVGIAIGLGAVGTPAVAMTDADDQEQPFYMGVYLYEYAVDRAARSFGREYHEYLEEHLAILHEHGVNAIYLGGTRREGFDEILALCEKYDISLIPQLDFAYFRHTWDEQEMDRNATIAGEFIAKYQDHPRVLAWSVREELHPQYIHDLARYYSKILSYAPRARFNKIHAFPGAAQDQPVPDPVIFGTDRYAFWWEYSGGGYLASPSFALNWSRQQAATFYTEAAKRGADYMFVVTQGGLLHVRSPNRLMRGEMPEREALRERVAKYVQDGRMGWQRFPGSGEQEDAYLAWKYYRLPANCMRALAWTSVMEGARLFFVWSYTPPDADKLAMSLEDIARQTDRGTFGWVTMAGRPGEDNPQLEEFAQASQEIRAYEGVIRRMRKTPGSPIVTQQTGVHHRGFLIPSMEGRIAVIHNANVGTWPHNSRNFFQEDDEIFIDDDGNLVDYKPFVDPLEVAFELADPTQEVSVYDVQTGRELPHRTGGFVVNVAPGSGTLIFVGNESELNQIRRWLQPATR